MHGLLSIERSRREPAWSHRAGGRGQRGAAQSGQKTGARSVSTEPRLDSAGLGHCCKSAPGRGASALQDAGERTVAAVSTGSSRYGPGSAVWPRSQEFMKTAILGLIRFYQSSLSPVIPSSCRFYPTCSTYAYESVATWGVKQGLWLALGRILRCRPFGRYGCDPVPRREDDPRV